MISFTIAAVLLSALAALLILQRAAGAARSTDADPTLAVYRRQLTEIDDLAERGLLAEGELRSAKAEASRRLLGAAEAQGEAASQVVSRNVRWGVLAGAVIAPLLAVGVYLLLGSPGAPDQPYKKRLAQWTNTNPAELTAPQMAAVLQTVAAQRPKDAEPLTYLSRAQLDSGNAAAAAETMRKATRLEPKVPELWANLGVLLLVQGQGEETAPAQEAFRQAAKLDPDNPTARFHLARAKIASGDVAGGLADWSALSASLPAGSPEKQQLDDLVAATAKAGHLIDQAKVAPPSPPQQQAQAAGGAEGLAGALTGQGPPQAAPGAAGAQGGDQRAFINTMVARLEDRLKADPSDVSGWSRLIRSYAVLGEPDKMQAALARAHQVFKGNPDALKQIDNAMAAPQGSE